MRKSKGSLSIVFYFAVSLFAAAALGFTFSGCDSGAIFSLADEVKGDTLQGGEENTPIEIVPSDSNPHELQPGNPQDNDEWDQPDVNDGGDDGDDGIDVGDDGDTDGDDGDTDGDHYDDGEDNYPEQAYYLCVTNHGASANWITLNDEIIFGTNSFHNEPYRFLCRVINPRKSPEPNTVAVRFAGSPGDSVDLGIFEWSDDEKKYVDLNIWNATLTRDAGTPLTHAFSFVMP